MGPEKGYPDQLGGARLADNVFLLMGNNNLANGKLPCLHSDHRVTGVRDLTTGYDSTQPDKKAILPVSASSQMVKWKMMMIEIMIMIIRESSYYQIG